MTRIPIITVLVTLAAVVLPCEKLPGQSFRLAGTELVAMRPVSVPGAKSYTIVVTDFLHHGQINAEGSNVVVATKQRELVPSRVLQLGPGDFCRLAIQTLRGRTAYEIYYGGDPPTQELPPWTARDGLILETRHYKKFTLDKLDSLREAFERSKPFGADYVENVYHAYNPFSRKPGAFLSRYSSELDITAAGTYGFLASGLTVGYLLIDGKEVVSFRGYKYWAKRGDRKDIQLAAGRHKFEYYHAATGPRAIMVAAWEKDPQDEKPVPELIPSDTFHTGSVGHLPAGRLTLRTARSSADFVFEITGDVPLPENPVPLVGVHLKNVSPQALTSQAKVRWDFGDGQSGDRLQMDHVYLRPGIYKVALSLTRDRRTVEIANRIDIDRPILTAADRGKFHKLDEYLPLLQTYDPHTLDAASLRQLVLAYEAKALALEAEAEARKP